MKKGFTLIELLGVIVILSIILLLTMPNIINSINKANKNTNQIMADMIFDSTKKYIGYNDKYKEVKGNSYCITIKELVNDGLLEAPVKYGDEDNIEDTKSVKATYNKKWNYSIVNKSECLAEANFICNRTKASNVTTGFIPNNEYNVGDEYICKINNTYSYHFFILSVNGGTVSLIADRNLQNDGTLTTGSTNADGWSTGNNAYGPLSAYSYIQTSTNIWVNIPIIKKFSFIDINKNSNNGYKGISVEYIGTNYITKVFTKFDEFNEYTNLRVRLPMYNEVISVGCSSNSNSCPTWMGGNLSGDSGYWLLDSALNTRDKAYYIKTTKSIGELNITNNSVGIRPVIELNKNYLE